MQFDACAGKPPEVQLLGPVDGHGRNSVPREGKSGGLPGPGEADHKGAARELHGFRAERYS
jgi:hypothetical protein